MPLLRLKQTLSQPWYVRRRRVDIFASVVDSKLELNRAPLPLQDEKLQQQQMGSSRADRTKALRNVERIFFPQNYPWSVTSNYNSFTKWSFMGSVGGTVGGVLSTQALLAALGMGSGSLPLAASLNWIIKDGLGLLGGVIYTSVASSRLDSEPKKYRLRAAFVLQISMFCEMISPLVPHLFLGLASVANIGKNMAWLTLSGTRAQMHQSLCLRDNLGDVTAKAGSQATAAGLVGTGLGIGISWLLEPTIQTSLLIFFPLGFWNMYCVNRSNYVVYTKSLNVQRLELALDGFLKSGMQVMPTPGEVSAREEFIWSYKSVFGGSLEVNPPLDNNSVASTNAGMTMGLQHLKNHGYGIVRSTSGNRFALFIRSDALPVDVLKGFFHVTKLRAGLSCHVELDSQLESEFGAAYQKLLDSGWNCGDLFIGETDRVSITNT